MRESKELPAGQEELPHQAYFIMLRKSGAGQERIYSSMPSCSLAASDMRAGVHGGSQTTSTFADVTFSSGRTLRCTSPGSVPATGQPGEVSVILISTAPLGAIVIS